MDVGGIVLRVDGVGVGCGGLAAVKAALVDAQRGDFARGRAIREHAGAGDDDHKRRGFGGCRPEERPFMRAGWAGRLDGALGGVSGEGLGLERGESQHDQRRSGLIGDARLRERRGSLA